MSSVSNWKKWITLTPAGEGNSSYTVAFYNGKFLGEFVRDVDGYYYYDGINVQTSHIMRILADALDELNKPLDDEINAYFEAEKAKEEPRGEEPPLNGWLYN